MCVGVWVLSPERFEPRLSRGYLVKSKPDLLLVLVAAFGLGVIVTLLMPFAANDSVAAPASELHAGIFIER